MIYLDHAATTPLDPSVALAMSEVALHTWGNPSSVHASGRSARAALELAREQIAACLNCPSRSVVFTASASEANNLALKGMVWARRGQPAHLVVSAIEHESVRMTARYLAARWPHVTLTEVAPEEDGIVPAGAIAEAIRPETVLIALMHANNETGAIQPIQAVSALAHARGIALHCDAVQSFGKIPVDFKNLGCDLLSLSAHKFYGPRGAGVLVLRKGLELDALIHGGMQEQSQRAGTENLPAILGMALAAQQAHEHIECHGARLLELERAFLGTLNEAGVNYQLNGSAGEKIDGVINLSFPDLSQDDLVVGMDIAGVAISAGSACSSGVIEPSHVLRAMGLPEWRCRGSIRISFGRENTQREAKAAAQALGALAQRLEAELPAEESRR